MARGRMISKAISLDGKVNALSDDTARLLWTWLIPHLDSEGRMYGDAQAIKSIVFPRRSISTAKVERILQQLEQKKLIIRYSVNGNTYLSAPNFEKHQLGIRKDRESPSQIPPITPDKLQSKSSKSPPEVKRKLKYKFNIKELKGINQILLNKLRELKGWGLNHIGEDYDWLMEFLVDYPELSESHIKACRDYHSDKPKHTTGQWKSRLRNWMVKGREIKREKQGEQSGERQRRHIDYIGAEKKD